MGKLKWKHHSLTGLKRMAGTTGLEPAASAVTGQRSNQLNYVPILYNFQLNNENDFSRFEENAGPLEPIPAMQTCEADGAGRCEYESYA